MATPAAASAAAAAIGSFTDPDTAPILLGHWRDGSPALRSEIVLAMLSGRSRLFPLLEAIRDGVIPANQVPFARRAALLRSTDAQVKELATNLFSNAAPSPRKEVVTKYQAALSLKGDATRGKKVFETACATCHRAGDLGGLAELFGGRFIHVVISPVFISAYFRPFSNAA